MNFARILSMGCICGKETVTVNGRKFLVLSILGEGGFSTIDLVEDRYRRRQFALKRIVCHSAEDERTARQEVDYMLAFNHPNLVPCEEHDTVKLKRRDSAISEMLIVMPFYKKGSLHDEIQVSRSRSVWIAEQRILSLLIGVCQGLKMLHSSSPVPLAHRDVKPHNVMLQEDDTPVLMDFGSMGPARVEVSNLSEARVLQDFAAERCSMPYRAPELFHVDSHSRVDESVDIWSLGCTLFALCFHESPFDAVHQRGDSIALAVLGNITIPPSRYSTDLMTLLVSMLKVDPSQRPSIDEILQTLSACNDVRISDVRTDVVIAANDNVV